MKKLEHVLEYEFVGNCNIYFKASQFGNFMKENTLLFWRFTFDTNELNKLCFEYVIMKTILIKTWQCLKWLNEFQNVVPLCHEMK